MRRRDFITTTSAALLQTVANRALDATPDSDICTVTDVPLNGPPADYTLRIAPILLEILPGHFISTIGYNDSSPGPVLRLREGRSFTIDVINDSGNAELVHWHGLFLPPDVDGAEEEGTTPIPPGARRRYRLVARPAGTRWYHSHAMSMGDLHRGTYTGQFGFLSIDSGADPGSYDQELFLALRDWEPFFTMEAMDTDEQSQRWPQTERPAVLDTRPNGLEVSAAIYSINDKALGAGEPIRVRRGERVLMHILNASAIENRSIVLPRHQFMVLALDGNQVPNPRPIDQLFIGPGERIDAYVEMNAPGIWIMGAPEDAIRNAGLGIIVEYANQRRDPQWIAPERASWDYTLFARPAVPEPTEAAASRTLIDMTFDKVPRGRGEFNSFLVNGKEYPHEREFLLHEGERYRMIWRNRTDDAHPLHLHRHLLELVEIYGKRISGLIKDTVVVPSYGRAVVDFVADQPGLSLFHCHIQQHMDFGFKALFRYA